MKKYISPCTISLSLTMPDGKHKHVSFDTNTGLGSSLYVKDKETQEALEKHPDFNEKFFLERVDSDEPQKIVEETKKEEKPRVFVAHTVSEAKEILNSEFGIPRSNIKTMSEVVLAATEHGIQFEGLTEKK